MSLWVGISGIVAVLLFATLMALSEMRHHGFLRERSPRMARDQVRELEIAAKLSAKGYTPEAVAYAPQPETGPEIVTLITRSHAFHFAGEMPALKLRVRAISLQRLEESARRAVARATKIDPSDVIVDLRVIDR